MSRYMCITRAEHKNDDKYTVIFQTDDHDKYLYIQEQCRKMVDREKADEVEE